MRRIINLADLEHLPVLGSNPRGHEFKAESLALARQALVSRNLRFDNVTGRIRDNTGELERYVNQSDFVPHASESEVMQWEFSRWIRNSASRIERGYKP